MNAYAPHPLPPLSFTSHTLSSLLHSLFQPFKDHSSPTSTPSLQRQKDIGSRGTLLPGKFLRVQKVFALNILLSFISRTCLENHWSFWKASRFSDTTDNWKLSRFIESFMVVFKLSRLSGKFQIVYKVSRLSVNFPGCIKTFKIGWKVIRLSEMFLDCPEAFKVVWKLLSSGKFPVFL